MSPSEKQRTASFGQMSPSEKTAYRKFRTNVSFRKTAYRKFRTNVPFRKKTYRKCQTNVPFRKTSYHKCRTDVSPGNFLNSFMIEYIENFFCINQLIISTDLQQKKFIFQTRKQGVPRNMTVARRLESLFLTFSLFVIFSRQPTFMYDSWSNNIKIHLILAFPKSGLPFLWFQNYQRF